MYLVLDGSKTLFVKGRYRFRGNKPVRVTNKLHLKVLLKYPFIIPWNKDEIITKRIKKKITSEVELILLVYQRPDNLKLIFNELAKQTYSKFSIRLHNNNPHEITCVNQIVKKFHNLNIKVTHSENVGSVKKLELAKNSQANILIFLDDDMIPKPNFIEYMVDSINNENDETILGWYAIKFGRNAYWSGREKVDIGNEVDFIGSGSMVLKHKFFEIDELYRIPEHGKEMEDIWISYIARKYGYKLKKVIPMIDHKHDKFNQYIKLKQKKYRFLLELRKRGWKFLKDMKYDFVVFVSTKDRENYLLSLLKQIERSKYPIKVIVCDDASSQNYRLVKDKIKKNNWIYFRYNINNGKHNYWKTVNDIWKRGKDFYAPYYVSLSDDSVICNHFFDKILKTYSKLDQSFILNTFSDKRVIDTPNQWGATSLKQEQAVKGLPGFYEVGWVDGWQVIPIHIMNQLQWRVNPISLDRWKTNKHLSSGVWQQITKRLVKKGFRFFCPKYSFVEHIGNHDSKMNNSNRKYEPLKAISFLGDTITVIQNSNSGHFSKSFLKSQKVNIIIEKNRPPVFEDIYLYPYYDKSYIAKNPQHQKTIIHFLGSDIWNYKGEDISVDGIMYPNNTYKRIVESRNSSLINVPNRIMYVPISGEYTFKKVNYNKKILLLGRIIPVKDIIMAIGIIDALGSEYSLDIIGNVSLDPLYVKTIKQKISKYRNIRLQNCINPDQVPMLIQQYDYILSTSERESVHSVVVEGISIGLCPIIRNWKGSDEIYPDFEKFSTIDEAVDIIRKFTSLPNKIQLMKKFSNKYTKRFSESKYISKFESLCEEILS